MNVRDSPPRFPRSTLVTRADRNAVRDGRMEIFLDIPRTTGILRVGEGASLESPVPGTLSRRIAGVERMKYALHARIER